MNTSRYSRRAFLRNTAVTLGSAAVAENLLTACTVPGGGGTAAANTVTINYWDWFISQAPWVDNEIKLFQQAHPNIKVKKTTQAVDKYPDLFALAEKGNSTPDVFMIPSQPDFVTQINNKWVRPVDDIVPASFKSRFPDGAIREGSNVINGKLYSAPLSTGGPWAQLYLDNQNFKQAGLSNADGTPRAPQTWDEIINAAETIKKKSNGAVNGLYIGNKEGNQLAWGFHMFALAAGAPGGAWGNDYRTGKFTYASNRTYQDTIEFLLEFKKRGLVNNNALTLGDELARVNFTQHKGGMIIGGVWNQASWAAAGYKEYGMTSLVPPSGTPKAFFYTSTGGTFVAVSGNTKHAKEAGAWFDWIYSKEAGKRWVQMGEDLSIFAENNNPSIVADNKTFAQYVQEIKLARLGPDPTVRNPDVAKIKVPSYTPSINDLLTGIWSGQVKDIHGALSELEGKANAALAQGIKDAQGQGLKVSAQDYIFTDWDPNKDYITKPKA
ncbi:hypothetical protein KDA_48320 [Dictyobacter alpinus]|uniref:Sugar ABC transporter substrate-binding protein n=1 Tax=Dictyobacter alpinus TaxID=2014873 RepID=A0A402BD72_9CHLR|nr:ABC transporter substrate-binding protein [Dictyobacter alpinus]GCE29348.1 hypothetical protein KDA_48320 [Dictyobacter alpinus]